jgi:NAD(P)-dependent dehydrogenase (short-subunit alcohol dehydrogenase family)
MLKSFDAPLNVLIIGANGGLGSAFCEVLRGQPEIAELVTMARSDAKGAVDILCNITDEAALQNAAHRLEAHGPFHLIINATGLLHDRAHGLAPEKSLAQIDATAMARVLQVNTIGPALVCKYLVPLLAKQGKAVMAHLSARVGSISDNQLGGWYSYRAAKAAQNMIVKTAALETARRYKNKLIIGLHPGTVATDLSAPFQSGVAPEKLFTAEQSASYLLQVIDTLTAQDSGYVLAFDGQRVPA